MPLDFLPASGRIESSSMAEPAVPVGVLDTSSLDPAALQGAAQAEEDEPAMFKSDSFRWGRPRPPGGVGAWRTWRGGMEPGPWGMIG